MWGSDSFGAHHFFNLLHGPAGYLRAASFSALTFTVRQRNLPGLTPAYAHAGGVPFGARLVVATTFWALLVRAEERCPGVPPSETPRRLPIDLCKIRYSALR